MPGDALELLPIDLSGYRRGNTGIDYVHRFDSPRDGPSVMVCALTHGNEICGAHALDWLFRSGVRPHRGSLTLCFANIGAYDSFDPANPTTSRYLDEDLNRVWADEILDGNRRSAELTRARELRPFLQHTDYLLDIHSMQSECPALMLAGNLDKGLRLARAVGRPAIIVRDGGHKAGPRMRDYGDFGRADRPHAALLVECGQHWQVKSAAVARTALAHFLAALDLLSPEDRERMTGADKAPPQRLIDVSGPVTIKTSAFRFVREFQGLETIEDAGTVIGYDGERAIATPYENCVLIMPSRRLRQGQTAVRFGRFVD